MKKTFRKNVIGGFNTRDVVDFIAQKSKEQREEIDALRAGADKLRRERDDAIAERDIYRDGQNGQTAKAEAAAEALVEERDRLALRVQALQAELDVRKIETAIPERGSVSEEREEMRLQFYEMRKERDALRQKLDATVAAHTVERDSITRSQREKIVFENERDSVLDTLTRREQELAAIVGERVAWLAERADLIGERQDLIAEREGYLGKISQQNANMSKLADRVRTLTDEIERAENSKEQVERNTREAEAVKRETARLVADTRARFDEVISGGKASSLEVVLELDRMRAFFAKLPERFADIEQGIAGLESDPRPRMREFVPEIFDGDGIE